MCVTQLPHHMCQLLTTSWVCSSSSLPPPSSPPLFLYFHPCPVMASGSGECLSSSSRSREIPAAKHLVHFGLKKVLLMRRIALELASAHKTMNLDGENSKTETDFDGCSAPTSPWMFGRSTSVTRSVPDHLQDPAVDS